MDLALESQALPPIPSAACLAFHQMLGTLTDAVNSDLEGRKDLHGLIGPSNLELMRDNHRNHAAFMDNVFFLSNYKLLARVVPWVYRVYTARGFSLDYFPVELQAWMEAIRDRIPPLAARPILEVYSWMIQHHEAFAECRNALHSQPPGQGLEIDLNGLVDVFLEGDFKAAERLTMAALGEQHPLEHFYLWILDPAMKEIGQRWERSEISSAQEHIASALVTRMMSVAYAKLDKEPIRGKRAVVCAGPGEQHQIGAWMVSDLLELRGWDARLIGASPSPEGLLSLLDAFRPGILALSVTMPFYFRDVAQLIDTIRSHAELEGLRIMVGGQAFAQDPHLWTTLGADGFAPDARSAALLAEGWWEEDQP